LTRKRYHSKLVTGHVGVIKLAFEMARKDPWLRRK